MADAYSYAPIIRLPKSKTSSSSTRSTTNNRQSVYLGTCEFKDTLVSETLYFEGLSGNVSEADIRNLLQNCQPIEIVIQRDRGTGYLRFADAKTADRVYSLYNGFTFPNGNNKLQFRISQDGGFEPEPKAPILHVKNLPLRMDNNGLYDLFRPFGPLSLCSLIVEGGSFRGTAFVQYFNQEDSDEAQNQLHGKIVEGNTLNVVSFMLPKNRATTPNDKGSKSVPTPAGPLATTAPAVEKSESGFVDYMNLYIKNLDQSVTNTDLFNLFRQFGRIVSARVMSNPATGQSKGYGFVSYEKPEEAAAALREMNGYTFRSKQLIVAYHEPKKPRQEKHAVNNNNNNNSTPNNNQTTFVGGLRTSPQVPDFSSSTTAAAGLVATSNHAAAAVAGINAATTAFTPHDPRNPYEMAMAPAHPIPMPTPVNGLGIDNVDQLAPSMRSIGQKRPPPPPHPMNRKFSAPDSNFGHQPLRLSPPFSSSPMSGVSSTGPSLASLASGIHRPNLLPYQQPPVQQQPDVIRSNNHNSNGRTLRRKGSLESISSVMTESSATVQRQRLTEAVMRCGDYSKNVNDIVDMLLTLKRKERSLCLFNQDFLRDKIQLAIDALETFDDDEEEYEQNVISSGTPVPAMPAVSPSNGIMKPPPRESKAIPIVAPPPETKSSPSAKKTSSSNNSSSNGASAANGTSTTSSEVQEIEQLLASLEGKPIHEKKQQLGDRLFPLVKATGTKQAPKVTIRLLDTIDLHELAHLMHDKAKLKERVDIAFAALK